jgi:hypothetical protein
MGPTLGIGTGDATCPTFINSVDAYPELVNLSERGTGWLYSCHSDTVPAMHQFPCKVLNVPFGAANERRVEVSDKQNLHFTSLMADEFARLTVRHIATAGALSTPLPNSMYSPRPVEE